MKKDLFWIGMFGLVFSVYRMEIETQIDIVHLLVVNRETAAFVSFGLFNLYLSLIFRKNIHEYSPHFEIGTAQKGYGIRLF